VATAFSILVFTETTMPSRFFIKKKPPCTIFKRQQVNRKRSSVGDERSQPNPPLRYNERWAKARFSLRNERKPSKELQTLWRFPPLKCVPA
jgi:hypothetical protein